VDCSEFKFKTSEFIELLKSINLFLSRCSNGDLLGLAPVQRLSTTYHNIRLERLDIDIRVTGTKNSYIS